MNVRIEGFNVKSHKLAAIKLVRSLTDWGLKESKDFVEAQPQDANGIISMTLSVNHALPRLKDIATVEALMAFILQDTYMPANIKIICLDTPAKKTRKTIASLEKQLADARISLDITSKSLSTVKNEMRGVYDRQYGINSQMDDLSRRLNESERLLGMAREERDDAINSQAVMQSEIYSLRAQLRNMEESKNALFPIIVTVGNKRLVIGEDGVMVQ